MRVATHSQDPPAVCLGSLSLSAFTNRTLSTKDSYLSSCPFFLRLCFRFRLRFRCHSRLLLRLPFRFRCCFCLRFRFPYGPSCIAHGVTNSSRYMFTKQTGFSKTTHKQTTMMLHSQNKMPPLTVVVTEYLLKHVKLSSQRLNGRQSSMPNRQSDPTIPLSPADSGERAIRQSLHYSPPAAPMCCPKLRFICNMDISFSVREILTHV